MRNKLIFLLLITFLLVIYGCAQPTEETTVDKREQGPTGVDTIKETTTETKIVEEEQIEEVEEEKEDAISSEVKELLSLADKKVRSITYRYKGPPEDNFFYEFSVRDNKIKYIIDPTFKDLQLDDESYDAIYLNEDFKTALAYCDSRKCRVKGKKTVLDYDQAYIMTPLDWLSNIEFAEKVGEELIDKRSTWKLSTNIGTMWIDTFFGVPVQVKFGDTTYKFNKMVFNGVKESDVTPS